MCARIGGNVHIKRLHGSHLLEPFGIGWRWVMGPGQIHYRRPNYKKLLVGQF